MKTADKGLTRRVDRLEAAAGVATWETAVAAWRASFAAVAAGDKSLDEHRAWVLSQHEPEKRETFKRLWQDTQETMGVFERRAAA